MTRDRGELADEIHRILTGFEPQREVYWGSHLKVADFIIRHTEELRKENGELKTIVSRLQGSLNAPATTAMSIMNDVYKERLENDRLKALVDCVEKKLKVAVECLRAFDDSIGLDMTSQALDEIAKFKKGENHGQ